MSEEKKKVRCTHCNGKGFYTKRIFHGKPFTQRCIRCKGTGKQNG